MKKLTTVLCSILLFVSIFVLATNYEFYRGDDHTFSLVFEDSGGTAIDISSWTVFFTVKNLISDTDANAEIARDITVHDDPTAGETSFVIYSTEAASFVGKYRYDIQYKNDSNRIRTVDSGIIEFVKDVTIRTTP